MTNLLLGKNILVTREATQALPLIHLLEDEGATCYHVPLLCFEAIFDEENRRQLLQLDQQADWLFFTSAKAVLFLINM
ncbi:hypothetical protein JCM21714_1661 [Gracilibacillus boraciitolerans JCM 21714]|uniref:Tetrapyrrole biosynthesis uroporphyrinogen III synthase domain-containing protein n=1 Tax=Gracilibacillus boraciitolerans JCM 21714 TaxID=1298598 RepID=W4VHL4_9BACI|nr:uroporphyrinogen-III synthase [Gracilibacillus boraciitolerans]GAE92651.1 hypothetical protein JCM21714_1661 [Gracilibacillus boraciitolerans JCM 21714]